MHKEILSTSPEKTGEPSPETSQRKKGQPNIPIIDIEGSKKTDQQSMQKVRGALYELRKTKDHLQFQQLQSTMKDALRTLDIYQTKLQLYNNKETLAKRNPWVRLWDNPEDREQHRATIRTNAQQLLKSINTTEQQLLGLADKHGFQIEGISAAQWCTGIKDRARVFQEQWLT